MNPRYVIHEEIDRYLNGQMGAAERRLFEAELATNASVRAEFEAQQLAHQVIFENSLLDLKKQMQRDMNGGGSTPPSSGLARNYRNWLIGIGGLLCVSSLYYFYSNSATENNSTTPKQESVTIRETPATAENSISTTTPSGNETTVSPTKSGTALTVVAPQEITITQTPGSATVADQPKDIKDDKPQANTQHTTPTTPSPATTTHPVDHNVPTTPSPGSGGAPTGSNLDDEPSPNLLPTAYTFQPEIEGNWTLPYKENTKGTFKIVSRSGVIVYQTNFSSGTSEQWNGNDAAGVPMPAGYYIYLIEYEKGGVEKGSLSILR